ncbi:MAG: hypothetical protein AAF088_09335 [Pseudomonadota bacterium]
MPDVSMHLRSVAGTEAAMGWAGSHTIVVDRYARNPRCRFGSGRIAVADPRLWSGQSGQ